MWSPATRLKPPSDRTLRPLYSTISTQFLFRFETLGATRCRAKSRRRHNIWWNYGNVITRMSRARVKGKGQENRFNLQAFVNEVTSPSRGRGSTRKRRDSRAFRVEPREFGSLVPGLALPRPRPCRGSGSRSVD